MTITYEYGGSLYVNLTNRCDCACTFCLRHNGSGGSIYTGESLWLEREPTREEALADFLRRDLTAYREIVFCGFGEPMFRWDDIAWLADALRERLGEALPPLRINTNGHADLILGRDVCGELSGRIQTLSISLNAPDCADYCALTRPRDGEAAWEAMLSFTRRAARVVPRVRMTVVDQGLDPQFVERCAALAESLGAQLHVRAYIPD